MSMSIWFWVIMFLWLVYGFAWYRNMLGTYGPFGGAGLVFVLLVLLGLKVFGSPITG